MTRHISPLIPASLFVVLGSVVLGSGVLGCGDAGSSDPNTVIPDNAAGGAGGAAEPPLAGGAGGGTAGMTTAEDPDTPMPTTGGAGGGTGAGGDPGSSGGDSTVPADTEPDPDTPTDPADMPRPVLKIPNEQHMPVEPGMPVQPGDVVAPTFTDKHNNQPSVFNGYLVLAGNSDFSTWNIEDRANPKQVAYMASEHNKGEAESHQVTFAKYADKSYMATISGRGFDIWDVTDMEDPSHTAHVMIDGINYGDVAGGVWGVAWQGSHIFIGGTDTGLHIYDVTDPASPEHVKTLPNSQTGGFYPGPLFPMGDLLVVTSPKGVGGVATILIADPENPVLLDGEALPESYIGWYYGGHVFLQTPLRVYDVLSDPTNITNTVSGMIAKKKNGSEQGTEYMSFGDDQLFLGMLRPNPGVIRFDVTDMSTLVQKETIDGRYEYNSNGSQKQNDDQFSLKVGNMIVLSDDEQVNNAYAGSFIAVESEMPDTVPPRVKNIRPLDGESLPSTGSVGISFSDQMELATFGPASFIVRPVGGEALPGMFGGVRTVVNFTPDEPFAPGEYEVVLPKDGVLELSGNGIAEEFVSKFTVK